MTRATVSIIAAAWLLAATQVAAGPIATAGDTSPASSEPVSFGGLLQVLGNSALLHPTMASSLQREESEIMASDTAARVFKKVNSIFKDGELNEDENSDNESNSVMYLTKPAYAPQSGAVMPGAYQYPVAQATLAVPAAHVSNIERVQMDEANEANINDNDSDNDSNNDSESDSDNGSNSDSESDSESDNDNDSADASDASKSSSASAASSSASPAIESHSEKEGESSVPESSSDSASAESSPVSVESLTAEPASTSMETTVEPATAKEGVVDSASSKSLSIETIGGVGTTEVREQSTVLPTPVSADAKSAESSSSVAKEGKSSGRDSDDESGSDSNDDSDSDSDNASEKDNEPDSDEESENEEASDKKDSLGAIQRVAGSGLRKTENAIEDFEQNSDAGDIGILTADASNPKLGASTSAILSPLGDMLTSASNLERAAQTFSPVRVANDVDEDDDESDDDKEPESISPSRLNKKDADSEDDSDAEDDSDSEDEHSNFTESESDDDSDSDDESTAPRPTKRVRSSISSTREPVAQQTIDIDSDELEKEARKALSEAAAESFQQAADLVTAQVGSSGIEAATDGSADEFELGSGVARVTEDGDAAGEEAESDGVGSDGVENGKAENDDSDSDESASGLIARDHAASDDNSDESDDDNSAITHVQWNAAIADNDNDKDVNDNLVRGVEPSPDLDVIKDSQNRAMDIGLGNLRRHI
ncbi:hypothetical protein H4R24_002466 [Coemansia sp. RSA 988]|nr:hypothetical protein H4R24_002466 [Coemansia sp. RSA 988]